MTSDLQQDHDPVFLPILGKNTLQPGAQISTSDGAGVRSDDVRSDDGANGGGDDASHGAGASRDDDASRDAAASGLPS